MWTSVFYLTKCLILIQDSFHKFRSFTLLDLELEHTESSEEHVIQMYILKLQVFVCNKLHQIKLKSYSVFFPVHFL